MAAPKKVDYERIEPDWRAGLKSPAQLAAEYTEATGVSVSRAAILKHFEKLGVPRDLSAKIQAKADAMVAEATVTGKVSTATTARDAEIINSVATEVVAIRIAHRKDIGRARALALRLLTELESPLEELALPARVSTLKALSETLKNLVGLEREAYGIDAVALPSTGSDVAVDQMDGARRIAFVLARATHQLNAQVH